VKAQFFDLARELCGSLASDEALLCYFSAEKSDFVRFNHSRVRQAGTVEQRYLSLRLLRAKRQAYADLVLAGDAEDLERCHDAIGRLREVLAQLPEDPWLLISQEPVSTCSVRRSALGDTQEIVERVTRAAAPVDFVGFYAGGTLYRGFANSYGQTNWHEIDSFNFDWSLHLRADKAVKDGYAGFDWDSIAFEHALAGSVERLALLQNTSRTIAPGEYRAYLAPRALEEVTGLLQLDAFSARALETRQSPLLRLQQGEALSRKVTLTEDIAKGVAPAFQRDGFVKPAQVSLINEGALVGRLISPRSAKEYGLGTNGANGRENAESLDLKGGELASGDALAALDTGLYIGNLWYLNYSDRPAGRITGMTRFACFWVERGRIVAPIDPVRFDDTVYRMLGANLIDFTCEREMLPSTSTYDERSTASARLPGALLSALKFTL
jgi:predicted Zn-dependent protease